MLVTAAHSAITTHQAGGQPRASSSCRSVQLHHLARPSYSRNSCRRARISGGGGGGGASIVHARATMAAIEHPRAAAKTQRNDKRAVVIGGGPGGALAALVLAQQGFSVDCFEARAEPDPAAQEPARSYALVRRHHIPAPGAPGHACCAHSICSTYPPNRMHCMPAHDSHHTDVAAVSLHRSSMHGVRQR